MSEKRYKRFYVSESENQLTIYDNEGLDDYYHLGNDERDVKGICKLLNEQAEIIRKQSIRIYCQDKEVQRLLGQLEKIPKSIREVWLED